MAAAHHAALLGGLDNHLGAVHMAGDDVATRVDQRIGGLRLAHGQGPVAGEDDLHERIRVHLARAQQEGVDVAEHGGDRLGGDEAELVGLRRQTGRHAIHIMGLVEIAEIAPEVLGVLGGLPKGSGVAELDLGIFLGEIDHEGGEIAEGGAQHDIGAIKVHHGFHRLGASVGFGDILLLDSLHACDHLQALDRDRMGLVPAKVVARTHIDNAKGDAGGQSRRAGASQKPGGAQGASAMHELTAGETKFTHRKSSCSTTAAPTGALFRQ